MEERDEGGGERVRMEERDEGGGERVRVEERVYLSVMARAMGSLL